MSIREEVARRKAIKSVERFFKTGMERLQLMESLMLNTIRFSQPQAFGSPLNDDEIRAKEIGLC